MRLAQISCVVMFQKIVTIILSAEPDFSCLADEIAEPRPDMNIKVKVPPLQRAKSSVILIDQASSRGNNSSADHAKTKYGSRLISVVDAVGPMNPYQPIPFHILSFAVFQSRILIYASSTSTEIAEEKSI